LSIVESLCVVVEDEFKVRFVDVKVVVVVLNE